MSQSTVQVAEGVYKRVNKDGSESFIAMFDGPRDPLTNRRRREKKTFRTKQEAIRWRRAKLNQVDTGAYIRESTDTIGSFLTVWLKRARHDLRPRTVHTYDGIIRNHLHPIFGALKLADLRPAHVAAFHSQQLDRGLHAATICRHHELLQKVLDDAVRLEMIARNPVRSVKPPKVHPSESVIWDEDQIRHFLECVADDDLAALWTLAFLTGMRRGEMLGLRWQDVDLDGAQLTVAQSLSVDLDRRPVLGEPKTRAAHRAIWLTPAVIAALQHHRDRQAFQGGSPSGLVFCRPDGRPLGERGVNRRFRALVERSGLPIIRLHDARHSHATLLVGENISVKAVADRLGHADTAITLNRYSHVTPKMQREAAEAIERAIG